MTASMTDIRVWLRENHPELNVQPRGKIKNSALDVFRSENPDDDAGAEVPPETPEFPDSSQEVTPKSETPQRGFRGLKDRLEKRKAERPKRRVSTEWVLSMGWSAVAKMIPPELLPVARCMEQQAPVVGVLLDTSIKGTLPDRLLQPVARAGNSARSAGVVIAPPLIVGAITMHPELYGTLRPILRECLKDWVLVAGPAMRRMKAREEKLLAELDGDMSSIDEMIEAFFAPAVPVTGEVIPDGEPAPAAA